MNIEKYVNDKKEFTQDYLIECMKLAYNQALEDAAKGWYYPLSGSNTKVVDLDDILSLKKH